MAHPHSITMLNDTTKINSCNLHERTLAGILLTGADKTKRSLTAAAFALLQIASIYHVYRPVIYFAS